jgi:peptidoglycan-associated lipoprotein
VNRKNLFVMVATLALAVACGGEKPVKEETPSTPVNTTGNSGVRTDGVATVNVDRPPPTGTSGALGPTSPTAAQRIIYFDFDSSDIRNEFVEAIGAHARYLAGNATVRVRLEGHTDERGSREYNITLGERRSQTVKRALMLQGVQEAQIATVSFGEERPAAAGTDEAAWSKNRRVEIVYIN